REHDSDMRVRLDQLADALEEGQVVVLRLERRDHADDERLRSEMQLLANLEASGRVQLEARGIDARRNRQAIGFWEADAAMLRAAGIRRVHDAVGVSRGLGDVLELLAIDQSRALRQRHGIADRPHDLDLAIDLLAHAVREDLRGVAPRVDDIRSKSLGSLDQLAEAAERKFL